MRWLSLILLLALSPSQAGAHEFWLDAEAWQVSPGGALSVRLRVGENLKGPSYVYNPNRFTRFEIVAGDTVTDVTGRIGDDPALDAPAPGDGLVVVVHETTDNRLTYREWDKFESFVSHKAFEGALARHDARGLPRTGFGESYRRFAKALIAVGDGAGSDRAVGLTTEIVAGLNPYTDDLGAGLPLLVLHEGAPRVGAQVELFDRAPDGTVTVTLHRTDDTGHVTVPVASGHTYLADAVILEDTGNDDPEAGPVWHSLWAATTFHVP